MAAELRMVEEVRFWKCSAAAAMTLSCTRESRWAVGRMMVRQPLLRSSITHISEATLCETLWC